MEKSNHRFFCPYRGRLIFSGWSIMIKVPAVISKIKKFPVKIPSFFYKSVQTKYVKIFSFPEFFFFFIFRRSYLNTFEYISYFITMQKTERTYLRPNNSCLRGLRELRGIEKNKNPNNGIQALDPIEVCNFQERLQSVQAAMWLGSSSVMEMDDRRV